MLRYTGRLLLVAATLGALALGAPRSTHHAAAAPAQGARPIRAAASQADDEEQAALQQAIEAAQALFGVSAFCSPERDVEPEPCLGLRPPTTAARGIVAFGVFHPGEGGFTAVMGRDADGVWGFWHGTQQRPWELWVLPGDLLACPGPQARLNVRGAPSLDAPVIATVEENERLSAERFVLTQPDSFDRPGPRGEGWYEISTPLAGWVSADFITDAQYGSCDYHDDIFRLR